jgi:putative molybdopterin biosynthesis protein
VEDTFLYQQIADSVRRDILEGRLKPGDRLPSMRQLREQWNCTPGTVQRAYNELAREGLLVSRAGKGTTVALSLPRERLQAGGVLRQANLVHRSEAFLLESLTAGYGLDEIQQALDLAMDRWRALQESPAAVVEEVLRFAGSHDLALNGLSHHFSRHVAPGASLVLSYPGSLAGLMAVAAGRADLAGCHLWDPDSDTYNLPYVRRIFTGREVTLITLAHRRQGLILPPGNPRKIYALADLPASGARFANRQLGSGTRVWLDAMLAKAGIPGEQIMGYESVYQTHSDVARQVAEGKADVGLGLETAAAAFGLDFVFLNRERYDLVLPAETMALQSAQKLTAWLASPEARDFLARYPGYDSSETGTIISI